MPVLKQTTLAPRASSTPAPTSPVAFSMVDLWTEAERVVADAQRRAETLLADAEQHASELMRAAEEQGRATGHAAGRREGLQSAAASIDHAQKQAADLGKADAFAAHAAELKQLATLFTAAAEALDAERRTLEETARRDCVRLALLVAETVTRNAALRDDAVLANSIEEAVRLVVDKSDVKLRVNPGQRALAERTLPQLALRWPELSRVELVDDAAVTPGGCVAVTARGEVDATIDGQLRRLADELQ